MYGWQNVLKLIYFLLNPFITNVVNKKVHSTVNVINGGYCYYNLQFQQQVKGSFRYRLGRMIDSTDCVVVSTPVRPDPIDNASVIVTFFEIYEKNKVNLSISWEHPNATYGDVSSYEVIVTKVPLSALDSIDTAVSVIFRTSGTFTLNVSWLSVL